MNITYEVFSVDYAVKHNLPDSDFFEGYDAYGSVLYRCVDGVPTEQVFSDVNLHESPEDCTLGRSLRNFVSELNWLAGQVKP